MKQVKLLLVSPEPGAKPEFLADLVPAETSLSPVAMQLWDALPRELVLSAYTRDAWACVSSSFASIKVKATDGRGKLPGFLDYLQQRKKSAYARFARTGICVISYAQQSNKTPNQMTCRICLDVSAIPGCNLKSAAAAPAVTNNNGKATDSVKQPKKSGLLGKLVGAQQRTNQHLALATAKPVAAARTIPTSSKGSDVEKTGDTAVPAVQTTATTAQQVLANFRQRMADAMLDFEIASDEQLQVKLVLSEHTSGLSQDDVTRVTMEVLKYMVYEAAEEVNEEWIAYKEPSEFMDDIVTITVYKQGAAPPHVVEETNKGELPDEVRGQQQAIAAERQRQVSHAEQKQQQWAMMNAHRAAMEEDDEEDIEVLNTNKRDRRTIEDFQREKRSKQSRS
jgi:hypothetical protein